MKMKRLLVFLMLVVSISGFAQSLQYSWKFDKPQIENLNGEYSTITYPGMLNFGKEGEPKMPYQNVQLLLPPGQIVESVEVLDIQYYSMEENVMVVPATRPRPLSVKSDEQYVVQPDEKIYSQNQAFPENNINNVNTSFLRGYGIGSFTMCPAQFFPKAKSLQLVKSVTVLVHTTSASSKSVCSVHADSDLMTRLSNLVENPQMLELYQTDAVKDGEEVDLLLITKADFMDDFQPYVDFKTSTGYIVEVKSVESIETDYSGADLQEKIRECIKAYYNDKALKYVVLGGDADGNNSDDCIIPHRGFFADPGSGYDDNDIPSDLYYACLDGNWNDDGDDKWGEPNEADLTAEVIVGRLCVDSEEEIANIIHKIVMYQNSPVVADLNKTLMVGEYLWPQTYGGQYMNELITGTSAHGYTTVGMDEDTQVTKLYEMEGNWEKQDVFNAFNTTGVNLVNHLGHSDVTYNMKMYTNSLTTTNFLNDGVSRGYGIGYSQGCYNGSFDNRGTNAGSYESDCFSEIITTIETAEVAMIGNSRYGWGEQGSTDGASQYFHRQYIDAIFGENITRIGNANQDCKEDNIAYINADQVKRWVCYESNLFGDPTMDVWTAEPVDMVAAYPEALPMGATTVSVQTDAAGARVALMQNNLLIGRGVANDDGDVDVVLFAPISSVEPVSISIVAHNKNRVQGQIIIVADQPYVILNGTTIHDVEGNNNGLADYGETIKLSAQLKNVGNQPATAVTATLVSGNEKLTVSDNSEVYGDFTAGQVINKEDAFVLMVANDVEDQTSVLVTLTAAGQSDWVSKFSMVLNAPRLVVGTLSIDDSETGNGNGRLDPGENVKIFVAATNAGHASIENLNVALSCASDMITITNPSGTIDMLAVGETKSLEYAVSVDAAASLNSIVSFEFNIEGGQYSAQGSFARKVGVIVEDFETGDFSKYNWSTAGSADWTISTESVHEGTYSAKSGQIGNSASSKLQLEYNVLTDNDTISFFRRVSSEDGYDFLEFYIDNQLKEKWSGEKVWECVKFPVNAGNHTFRWEYKKDSYSNGGSDQALIDYITLPAAGDQALVAKFTTDETEICEDNFIQFTNQSLGEPTAYSWSFEGGTPASSTEANPQVKYSTPGTYSVELTVTKGGESHTVTKADFIVVNNCNSVLDIVDTQKLTMWPNPSSGVVELIFNGFDKSYGVTIANVSGQVVMQADAVSNFNLHLNLQHLHAGVYFVTLKADNGQRFTQKLLINK